ncbi:exonuclease SbcD [Catalinimonas alkaloidigena]|uniref:Nuclease SbcCD subunit D n=1 Tax=Catalinimonas alkaloidigena TaxID=1075417 RepID=A0A1G9N332_9BACT|nr:exonuclease SbcCD subunit D [Catalinimonas alkaloidigena]SDL80275.1 exonuclease SbcD [Catalinimonas alkaloidigena]
MKILHTADWHLGKKLNEYSRLEEQRAVLDEICQLAEREAVDAVLIAGDLYDNFKPSNEASELFYATIHRLSAGGKRAVVAIAGNHDSADGIQAPDPLARACGIVLAGRPTTTVTCSERDGCVSVVRSAPGFVELKLPHFDYPLRLLLTPYANEALMRRFLGTEDQESELRTLLQDTWQQLADAYCDAHGVNMMVAHLYFMQKDGPAPEEPDDEKPILHLGGAQAIYTENLPPQLQYVALGHLHRYQTVAEQPCPVVYSSSPLAYSFSEANQPKFVVLIDAEPGRPVQTQSIRLQAGRKLLRKRFESPEAALAWLPENPDTFLELTLVSDTYLDAPTKKALYDSHDGIVSLIPELRTQTAEGEEEPTQKVDLSKDLKALFCDYFQARKGQQPNEDLLALFDEVIDVDED